MEGSELREGIPFHQAFFKASHNSYEHSIKEQLDRGVRGLEYDIHDDKIQELDDFEVYHLPNHINVKLNEDGNPKSKLLSEWLALLVEWSDEQKDEHSPITLFIEFKDSIVDENNQPDDQYGIGKLNKIITDAIEGSKLYTYRDFRNNNFEWPTVQALSARILIVLTSYWGGYWASSEGGFESRLKYLKNCLEGKEDVCFVSWIEEDKGEDVPFLKEKTHFWKCSLEYSTKEYEENNRAQRLTRADFDKIIMGRHVKTYYKKNYEAGYRCNFLATDSWNLEKYDKVFPWSI